MGTAEKQDSGRVTPVAKEKVALSSPDAVIQAICKGIGSGRYVPGQRLIEADLTRELGVSRGPVREALKRLAAQRIITLTRHKGAYIRSLTWLEVRDLLQNIEVLLGLAARLAAQRIDENGHRARFETVFQRLLAHQKREFSTADLEERDRFYGVMIDIGGNTELPGLLPATLVQLLRLQFQSYQQFRNPRRRFREYRAMGEAVLAGDTRRAERCTRLHIRSTRLAIQRLPADAFFSVG